MMFITLLLTMEIYLQKVFKPLPKKALLRLSVEAVAMFKSVWEMLYQKTLNKSMHIIKLVVTG